MIRLYKKKIGLTPMGHEAINTPSAVFASRMPARVRQHLYDAKRDLFLDNWGQCVLDTHKAIEAAYKQLIVEAGERDKRLRERVDELARKGTSIDTRTAGQLHNIMVETGRLKSGTFECWLSNEVTRYRPRSHDVEGSGAFSSEDAYRCELYTGILMRNLYT